MDEAEHLGQQDSSHLRCFVIGPIGSRHAEPGSEARQTYEEALEVWEEVIVPACQAVGLQPIRADGLTRAGEITDQIFHRLRDDDVVIADLTGANANVMYELGLRHSKPLLTVQIGEYGRLPFDVSVIRTVLFSRSPRGLINARDELIPILEAGLAGEFDPVSATRVWNDSKPTVEAVPAQEAEGQEVQGDEEPPGFVDLLVEAENEQDGFREAITAVNQEIGAAGEAADRATAAMQESDAKGLGMKGRLAIATNFARELDAISDRLERHVGRYGEAMDAISGGNLALIGRMEEDAEALEEGRKYGMAVRQLAKVTRESMQSLAGMLASMRETAKVSRVLRSPTRRFSAALDQFGSHSQQIDEWDRRLQALGIPIPPDDWEFDPEDDTGVESDSESHDSDGVERGLEGQADDSPVYESQPGDGADRQEPSV